MSKKIKSPIIGYSIIHQTEEPTYVEPEVHYLDLELGPRCNGPLHGLTMKVRNPATEEASIYVTCNFTQMDNNAYRLSEVFLNCKDAGNLQWATLATRQLSALARRTGRIGFMIQEMKQVSDATGGYRVYIDETDEKPTFVRSSVAHIGHCIERACRYFDVIDSDGIIKEHNHDYQPLNIQLSSEPTHKDPQYHTVHGGGEFDCNQCHSVKSVRLMDGCMTCSSCGFSSCG